MILSERLNAVADLVTPGLRLADIGTDHAYIPIFLVEQGRIPSAIAMDINRGPLKIATEHIREYRQEDRISTRLSDGLKELKAGEADSIITAGMGGTLIIRILQDNKAVVDSLKEMILQPQSEIGKVREYLVENGYSIVKENMVIDDGKYYSMMKAVKGDAKRLEEEELEYGPLLLKEAHPVLKEFLEREIKIQTQILTSLEEGNSERAMERAGQIRKKIGSIESVLDKYFERQWSDEI